MWYRNTKVFLFFSKTNGGGGVNDNITLFQWIIPNIVILTSLIKNNVCAKKLLIFCMAKQRRKCDIVSFKATLAKKEEINMLSLSKNVKEDTQENV